MRIRKFTAPTLAEALAQVKRELGEQAILLKTRPLDPRLDGRKGYEVTAAQDQEPLVSVREPLAPVPPPPKLFPVPPVLRCTPCERLPVLPRCCCACSEIPPHRTNARRPIQPLPNRVCCMFMYP